MHQIGNLAGFFETQRIIFGICPHCQALFRLSDIKISYKRRFSKDWFDNLQDEEEEAEEERMKLQETLQEIRRKTVERSRRVHLPKMLRQADPVFTPLGYYPQDVKAIFDPLDFVIFDGMNLHQKVKRIVFVDEQTTNSEIRRVQSSIQAAIRKDRYEFQSVRLTKTGQIQP
ncbi:MAG: Holliday junction resolvase-like protein [Candidatus Bathyarchaeia archaeon]|jgi:predicted Holliday junction resolvase-like endonuclease